MPGSDVSFPSDGPHRAGYRAVPDAGSGPGVVVIQAWWGLDDQIRAAADRFADEGFTALVPDLYRGATTTEPDEARALIMALNVERAAKDMAGAVDDLVASDDVTSRGVGVVGSGLGGGLALWLATLRSDAVAAVVLCDGLLPWPAAHPDYSRLAAPVQGHAAGDDERAPAAVRALEEQLRALGPAVEFFTDPDPDPDHPYLAWRRTIEFLRAHVR
jgi:carboxymethylenebutenolidase